MWLGENLRMRAGALTPAAERFLHGWLGEGAACFAGGARGLVSLCRHMERWLELEGIDEEGERRFVEGAGALLGMLLIDHVGDAAHVARGAVHRLRLGQHGYFDPFAAIEQALDAEDVREELARHVALAEAEAASRGPVSRVVTALLAEVERERPDLRLVDHFDLSLSLRTALHGEPLEVDLRRAVESTRDQGMEAVHKVARRLLSMLPGAASEVSDFAELRARLIPRLARGEALGELDAQGQTGLYRAPLTDELVVALLLEYDGRARYVKESELSHWQVSRAEALQIALENLAARSEHARIAASETAHGPLWIARTGDGRDSARVLLKSLYAQLSARCGERIVVSMPHRDTFFACAGDNRALVQALAHKTAHDAERAPHRLSARLFQLTATGVLECALE
ncbi:MAG: hypothetical protein JWN48_808 [Myxococcaceae bacterium]|nr:hypothetical protein [Myxococcaceae bacterium]